MKLKKVVETWGPRLLVVGIGGIVIEMLPLPWWGRLIAWGVVWTVYDWVGSEN